MSGAELEAGDMSPAELAVLAKMVAAMITPAAPPPRITNSSHEVAELMAALAKAQGAVAPIIKSKTATVKMRAEKGGGEYQYNFADLAMVLDALREPLSTNGLAIIQRATNRDTLETILAHESGQWIASYMPLIGAQGGPQAFGSAVTYARRYALVSLLGVSGADDDGAAAQEVTDRSRGQQARPSRARSSSPSKAAPKRKPAPKRESAKQAAERKAAVVKWSGRWVEAYGSAGVSLEALEGQLGHKLEDCTKVEASGLQGIWAMLVDKDATWPQFEAMKADPGAESSLELAKAIQSKAAGFKDRKAGGSSPGEAAPKDEQAPAPTGAVAPGDEPGDDELTGQRQPGED